MTFKELREASSMNKTDFGAYFGIPFRTIQNWERGERKCPEYLLELMEYKLKNEGILKGGSTVLTINAYGKAPQRYEREIKKGGKE